MGLFLSLSQIWRRILKTPELKVIGLTGGICCGKSTAAEYLRPFFKTIDADQVVHQLYQGDVVLCRHLSSFFGPAVLFPDGSIDRKELRKLAFLNSKNLSALKEITHFPIQRALKNRIDQARLCEGKTLVQIPLLFENSWQEFLDGVLLIGASREVQIQRVMSRDQSSQEDAINVLAAQMPLENKKALSTWYIENNEDLLSFQKKLYDWAVSFDVQIQG